MLISLTVGKVDAGVAVLLTEDKRLVTPPSFWGAALTFTDLGPRRSNFPLSFSLPQSPQVA